MKRPGSDSPDREVDRIPGLLVVPRPDGLEVHHGCLVAVQSTVNESVRSSVGWTRKYAEGYAHIFREKESSVN